MLYYVEMAGNQYYIKPTSETGKKRYEKKFGKKWQGNNSGQTHRWEYATMFYKENEAKDLAMHLNGIVRQISEDNYINSCKKLSSN